MSDGACCHYCRSYRCICPDEPEPAAKAPRQVWIWDSPTQGVEYREQAPDAQDVIAFEEHAQGVITRMILLTLEEYERLATAAR